MLDMGQWLSDPLLFFLEDAVSNYIIYLIFTNIPYPVTKHEIIILLLSHWVWNVCHKYKYSSNMHIIYTHTYIYIYI